MLGIPTIDGRWPLLFLGIILIACGQQTNGRDARGQRCLNVQTNRADVVASADEAARLAASIYGSPIRLPDPVPSKVSSYSVVTTTTETDDPAVEINYGVEGEGDPIVGVSYSSAPYCLSGLLRGVTETTIDGLTIELGQVETPLDSPLFDIWKARFTLEEEAIGITAMWPTMYKPSPDDAKRLLEEWAMAIVRSDVTAMPAGPE